MNKCCLNVHKTRGLVPWINPSRCLNEYVRPHTPPLRCEKDDDECLNEGDGLIYWLLYTGIHIFELKPNQSCRLTLLFYP